MSLRILFQHGESHEECSAGCTSLLRISDLKMTLVLVAISSANVICTLPKFIVTILQLW